MGEKERVRRWVPTALALLALSMTACTGPTPAAEPHHLTATPAVPASSPLRAWATATTIPVHPATVAPLGGSLTLSATDGSRTASLKVTLDRVIDPIPGYPYGSRSLSLPGFRWVELKFTAANTGAVTVPALDEGDPDVLSLEWVADPDFGDLGGGNQFEGLPSASRYCRGSTPGTLLDRSLVPGAVVTACIAFQIPTGLPVTSASVYLSFAGDGNGPVSEWVLS
jgi:hypothetical protein